MPGRTDGCSKPASPWGNTAWLVGEIRENHAAGRGGGLDKAIDKAITAMPGDFISRPFLLAHRAEVKGMLMTEYDESKTIELFREEGRREGILDTLRSLVQDKVLSVADAATRAGISEEALLQRIGGIRMDA